MIVSTTRLRRSVLRMKAATALRIEVGEQALVAGVALAALGDLGLDVGLRDLDALDVRHLGQDQQGLDPLLGTGAELGVEVVAGLLDRLEVGLLA